MLARGITAMFAVCLIAANVHAQPQLPAKIPQPPVKLRVDALGDPLPAGAMTRLSPLRMQHNDSEIFSVLFSRDGTKAISNCANSSQPVQIWDLATGKELVRLTSEDANWLRVLASRDGTLLAGIAKRSIQVWNLETAKLVWDFATDSKATWFSFKGNNTLIAIDQKGQLEQWNLAKGERELIWNCLAKFQKPIEVESPLDLILEAVFSPDAKVLVAHLGFDLGFEPKHGPREFYGGVMVAWDVATGKEIWRKVGSDAGYSFIFSTDGRSFVQMTSRPNSGDIQLCEALTGKVRARLARDKIKVSPVKGAGSAGTPASMRLCAIAPDCKTVAITTHDSKVFIRDASGQQPIKEIAITWPGEQPWNIPHGEFSPDSSEFLAFVRKRLQLINLNTGKQVEQQEHAGTVSQLIFSADGRSLMRQNFRLKHRWTAELLTWDIATAKLVDRSELNGQEEFQKDAYILKPTPHHTLAAALEIRDKKLEQAGFIDVVSGKWLAKFEPIPNYIHDFWAGRFSPSTRYFVAPPDDDIVSWSIFDVKSGKEVCKLSPVFSKFDVAYAGLAFSPDETRFALQDENGVIRLGDTATGKVVLSLGQAWDEKLRSSCPVAFSPNGKFLASWNHLTGDLCIWNLKTRKEMYRLPGKKYYGHEPQMFCWSPDGRMLADAGITDTNTIRIWEVATAKLRRQITGHAGDIHSLAFSPDSRLLASGSAHTTVLIWDLMAN